MNVSANGMSVPHVSLHFFYKAFPTTFRLLRSLSRPSTLSRLRASHLQLNIEKSQQQFLPAISVLQKRVTK